MSLPASGTLALSQISVELGRAANATTSLGEAAVRTLAGVASGPIAMSNLYGKANKPASVVAHVLVVSGAGNGGNGGNGGGGVWIGDMTLDTGIAYPVSIGGMGGGVTTFNGIAPAGGSSNFGDSGEHGGSQPGNGGGMGWGSMWTWPGDPNGEQWYCAGGGGGGAGEPGGNGSNDGLNGAYPGKGGNGIQWGYTGQYYGAGRNGVKGSPNGQDADVGAGWGNFGGGTDGGVIIVYAGGKALFSGGSVSINGDNVFHTFGGSSALNPT